MDGNVKMDHKKQDKTEWTGFFWLRMGRNFVKTKTNIWISRNAGRTLTG
jgi:hypothetical protein